MSDTTKLVKIKSDYGAVKKEFQAYLDSLEKEIPNFGHWMFMEHLFQPLWNSDEGELFHWYYFTKSNPTADKAWIIKPIEVGNTQ